MAEAITILVLWVAGTFPATYVASELTNRDEHSDREKTQGIVLIALWPCFLVTWVVMAILKFVFWAPGKVYAWIWRKARA